MDIRDPQKIWPGWETVCLLGRGSFGAVYEIRRRLGGIEEHAAVKCLSIPQARSEIDELRMSGYDAASITRHFDDMKDRLLQEYSAMACLKGSTNVVYCDDLRTERRADGIGWDLYIKMELLTPLTSVLGSGLSEEESLRLGRDIARALVACHRENIVHRDVKPQNIFVNRDGTYKLGDFGIARTMEGTGSASARTGTYRYMAPEVYSGQHYGVGADIYSLGLVLYWLLNNGRAPFVPAPPALPGMDDEDRARIRRFSGEPLPPPAHGSAAFQRVVLKACAFDPAERYQSAAELLRALEDPERNGPPADWDQRPAPAIDDDPSGTLGVFPNGRPPIPPAPAPTPSPEPVVRPTPSYEPVVQPTPSPEPVITPPPGRGLKIFLVIVSVVLFGALTALIALLVSGGISRPDPSGGQSSVQQSTGSAALPSPDSVSVASPTPTPEAPTPTQQTLTATVSLRGSASFEDVAFIEAAASSWLVQDNRYYFYPKNAIDPDSIDPWVENVSGSGIGETLTLYFDGQQSVRYLSLRLGYANNESLYRDNNRPSRLRLSFSDGSSVVCEFQDINAEQLVSLSQTVETSYVQLTILDVYAGAKYDDTCIFKVFAGR